MSQKENKNCFIIAPIGEKGSDTRRRSDQILNLIIKPTAKDFGYNSIRADEISKPGMINQQIIQHLLDDSLVIADLSEQNPNVFYELAIRHVIRKPVIQIIQEREKIPFDISGTRAIKIDYPNWDTIADCKNELKKQIESLENNPGQVTTPFSIAIDQKFLKESENPLEKSVSQILTTIQKIENNIDDMYVELSDDINYIPDRINKDDNWPYK